MGSGFTAQSTLKASSHIFSVLLGSDSLGDVYTAFKGTVGRKITNERTESPIICFKLKLSGLAIWPEDDLFCLANSRLMVSMLF